MRQQRDHLHNYNFTDTVESQGCPSLKVFKKGILRINTLQHIVIFEIRPSDQIFGCDRELHLFVPPHSRVKTLSSLIALWRHVRFCHLWATMTRHKSMLAINSGEQRRIAPCLRIKFSKGKSSPWPEAQIYCKSRLIETAQLEK